MPPTEKEPVMLPNAFTVMMAAQQRGGLPFQRPIKDARDRMFNDLIDLLREMGIQWKDPAATLSRDDSTKKTIKAKAKIFDFMKHYCRIRHYSFQVKKCGLPSCSICKPVRMDSELFKTLHFMPDPIPGDDDHYKRYVEVYGLDSTTEEHRPSLLTARKTALQSLGFTPSQQHVRNVGVLIQCDECGMWRLLFSKQKLNYQELSELERSLDDVSYSCGLSL